MAESKRLPSEVFAARLRELRKARGLSQGELAQLMKEAGRPMSRAAVQAVEAGTRGISLDEVLAFAAALFAVPTQLLSPVDDETVWLTDKIGVRGDGMRQWLRFGDAFIAGAGDLPPERREDLRQQAVLVHARALLDAHRANDKAGMQEAFRAIRDTLKEES